MKHATAAVLAAMVTTAGAGAAWAGPCTEQIKALQESAAKTDAKNSPGSQEQPTDTGAARTEGTAKVGADKGADANPARSSAAAGTAGGGTKSASEKILEATAHDKQGEEAKCMEAIGEAKKLLDT